MVAESKTGTAAQVTKNATLRKEPKKDAASLGKLPKGTVVTLTGTRDGDYVGVQVELEEGTVEGWIKKTSLNKSAREDLPSDTSDPEKKEEKAEEEDEDILTARPRSKLVVPKDEGLLLRREPTFFYGLQANGGLAIMTVDSSGTLTNYIGPALAAGAHVGFFLVRNIPARVEVSYSLLSGTDTGSGKELSFGFFDGIAVIQYTIEQIEFYGGIQYSYGLSLSEGAGSLNIGTAADLSSLYAIGGAGYRINLSDVATLCVRARYGISFLRAPVGFQVILGGAYLEFRG